MYSNQDRSFSNEYDRYYVMLKDGYTVADFSKRIGFLTSFGYQKMEYVGGQNKCVIVICKESFLNRNPFKSMIDSYAPFPLLARVSPSVITALSKASKNHTALSLSITSISGSPEKLLNLNFADNQEQDDDGEEENSSSRFALFMLSSRCYHSISEGIETFEFISAIAVITEGGEEFSRSPSSSSRFSSFPEGYSLHITEAQVETSPFAFFARSLFHS